MDKLTIFLSYSTDDKQLAGKIKEELVYWGVDGFLAHEDLVPSSVWQDEIIRKVESCDVFVPILTGSFRLSDWTDQESGMAVIKKKAIMPVGVTRNPHGFLGKHQAFPLDYMEPRIHVSIKDLILAILATKPELKVKIQGSFIHSLIHSRDFQTAIEFSRLLDEFGPYAPDQVNEIIRGSVGNNQIYESVVAAGELTKFYSKNEEVIERNLKKQFKETFVAE